MRLDHEFDAVWSANATTRVSEMRLEQFGHFLGTDTPLFGSTFPFLNFHLPVDTREVAANANLVARFSIGPTRNTVLFGADSDHVGDKIRDDIAFAGLVDFTNPMFPAYTPPITSAFNANNLYVNSGFTTQWQSDIYERLHLLAGMRFANVYIHGTDTVTGSDFVTNAWKPLPRVGAVVDLVKGVSAFADYSQGYRGVPFFNAAGAPKPEEAEQTEAGLKLALPSGFAGTLAWFTNTRRNVMNLLPGSLFPRHPGRRAARGRLRCGPDLGTIPRSFDPCELRACQGHRHSGPALRARQRARARAARFRPALGELQIPGWMAAERRDRGRALRGLRPVGGARQHLFHARHTSRSTARSPTKRINGVSA